MRVHGEFLGVVFRVVDGEGAPVAMFVLRRQAGGLLVDSVGKVALGGVVPRLTTLGSVNPVEMDADPPCVDEYANGNAIRHADAAAEVSKA
jgi:hypothetical protein